MSQIIAYAENHACFKERTHTGGRDLETNQALDRFLLGVERRALRMATISTGNPDDALDIVQDAMMKLACRYGNRQENEWGGLFHRILQNTITDWHRRSRVRSKWQQLFHQREHDDPHPDPIQSLPDPVAEEPVRSLTGSEAMKALEQAIHILPLRQQQAFLLRLWEGLSVAGTAQAMGCSEGSVKTLYSRAVTKLREKLKGYWP